MISRYVLLFALGFSNFIPYSISLASPAQRIQAVVPSTLGPPFLVIQDKELLTGILPDYLNLVAEALGKQLQMVPLPKYRIDNYMAEEEFDINCYTSPEWVPNAKNFGWSKPWFLKKELIFGKKPMPKNLKGLEGKIIGTVLGYKYPMLEPFFEAKKIIREDASDEEANFNKLINYRLSYVVTDEFSLEKYLKKHPKFGLIYESLVEQVVPIQCALNRESPITLKQLNTAIDQIKNSNKMETILSKY